MRDHNDWVLIDDNLERYLALGAAPASKASSTTTGKAFLADERIICPATGEIPQERIKRLSEVFSAVSRNPKEAADQILDRLGVIQK